MDGSTENDDMSFFGPRALFSGFLNLAVSSPPVRWGLLDFMLVSSPSPPPASSSRFLLLPPPPPVAILWVQCGVLDPNRDPASSVWRAGPQPRSCEFSVACRTPTVISWVQCCVPDLNCDPASSVWRAGPQLRSCEFSVACRTSSEFGLAAMAEVVVERPETIFIGTANQVAKGVEHVWRYKLTFVGAERMYVCMEPPSTTHAGDLMFIMEEVVEGNKWYVAYEGRPVPNAEGEQELEKRAAVFRTSASFWEDGVHEWETNNVRSRATYAEPAQAPQWRASDFMVCTRHEM